LYFSLNIEVTGSHVPHKSPDRTLATSMPDADRAVNRHLPDLSCGNEPPAVLTSSPRFDTSSVVHLRSTLRSIPDQIEFGLFLSRSPPRLLNAAAVGGLEPPPVQRLRGVYPHLLCSIAAPRGFHPLCVPSWHTLVGMERIALQQEPGETVGQGLQGNADAANPFCQGGAGEDNLITGGDLPQPVKREMIQVFGCYHPSQQTHRRHAAVYHGGRDWCGSDGHAASARILWTDMAMDEELGRFNVQLLGDVFANLDQLPAALAAGARFRSVPVFDAAGGRAKAGDRHVGAWVLRLSRRFPRL
jgi:hypothetical protein